MLFRNTFKITCFIKRAISDNYLLSSPFSSFVSKNMESMERYFPRFEGIKGWIIFSVLVVVSGKYENTKLENK